MSMIPWGTGVDRMPPACRRLGTGGEWEGTQDRHVQSQLKLRDGNARCRGQNIQGPIQHD